MFPITELIYIRVGNEKILPQVINASHWNEEDDWEWDECPNCGSMVPSHINCNC